MDLLIFKDIEIFEVNGSSKVNFGGSFTPNEFVRELIERWIPFYECHKCGKGDYCKYTVPYPSNPKRKQDIQCGVAQKALENYIMRTFHVLDNANKQKQQQYIDSAFYFFKYIYLSEQLNGVFIDNDKLDYWGEYSTYFFKEMLSVRDILNEFGKNFKVFPEIYKGQSLLLVEGETELKFIENLRGDSNFSSTLYFIADSYKGKGNKLPKRIQMLIDDYIAKGYSIYFQGDEDGNGDGSGYDKFKYYVENGSVPIQNIFQFKYDFESSIPRKLLHYILQELGYLKDISREKFNNRPEDRSINAILKEEYGINTESYKLKTQIAKKLGKIIFHFDRSDMEKLKKSELHGFINFIQNIR